MRHRIRMRSRIVTFALIAGVLILLALVALALSSTEEPNIAWYAEVQALDPIFAIEGTDPTKLSSAIDNFLQQRDEFAAAFSPSEEHTIDASLYPVDFLKLLPSLETARQTLITAPTLQNAFSYHQLLLRTIDAYESGAKNLAGVLNKQSSVQIGFLGGQTTTAYIAAQLETAINSAEEQKEKEDARFACMRDFNARQCASVESLSEKRGAALAALAAGPALSPPDSDAFATDALMRDIIDASSTTSAISPAIALKTPCFPYPVTYMRALTVQDASGTEWRPSIMNDAFFWDLPALAQNDPASALYRAALREGASLNYQNIANYYMCPDAGFYAFDIGRVLGTRELALQTAGSAQAFASSTLQVSDAARYAQETGTREAAERALEGSADFDEVIRALMSENNFILLSQKNGGYMQYSYLFAARSYAPILFFFGNPTFVSQPQSFINDSTSRPPFPALLSWRNDLSATMSADAVIDAGKKTISVLSALSK